MPFLTILIAFVAGYKISNVVSHPKSKVWQKMPRVRIKQLELLPSIRITVKGRVIHFHHWFNYSILLGVSVFVTSAILDSWVTRGFLMGSIIQGLGFQDRSLFPKKGNMLYSKSIHLGRKNTT